MLYVLQINPELNFKQFTNQCMKSCEKNSNNMSILNAEQLIKNVKQNYLDTQDLNSNEKETRLSS